MQAGWRLQWRPETDAQKYLWMENRQSSSPLIRQQNPQGMVLLNIYKKLWVFISHEYVVKEIERRHYAIPYIIVSHDNDSS